MANHAPIAPEIRPFNAESAISSLFRAVLIHGPWGCGKTRNAARFMAAFGCETLVDEWRPGTPIPDRALVLTGRPPEDFPLGLRVLSFVEALEILGVRHG